MNAIRRPRAIGIGLGVGLLVAVSAAPARAADLAAADAKGAALFADPALGTNGKSCATCHGGGAAWAGRPRFPKVALGGPRTLDQAIQICIANALAGRPLAWDDERLTALAVWVDRRYAPGGK